MTDSNATELLRRLLDERGVEWQKWTKNGKRGFSNVETCWFVPSEATKLGESFFCKATVCVNHPEGPLHYKGYVVSPQAAIEASLGKADDANADGATLDELKELRDLACDINAAEIIDHVHITHRGWTFDSQWLDSWHREFDRLADRLEQAIAATLGSEPDETELTQIYDVGFKNGVMAVFQQLEGIEDYEGLQDLIAEYWAEGEGNDER